MGKEQVRLAIVLIVAGFACGCATTPSVGAISSNGRENFTPTALQLTVPSAAPMPSSSTAATVPTGFISFCMRFTDQCRSNPNEAPKVALNAATWATLQNINASVNDSIWAEDDELHYGRSEYWTIPTDGYGDCEDYALTKKKELMAAGFPVSSLRIAVVGTPRDKRHSVLTVVTDRGDFVLDNLRDDVVAWNVAGYRWIERQDPSRPYSWVSLDAPTRMLAQDGEDVRPTAAAR